MSYDLWVWAGPPLDEARLAEAFDQVAKGRPSVLQPSEALAEVVREVTAVYPALEALPDGDLESSPWSVSPEAYEGLACFSMAWPGAAAAAPVIVAAALRRGLRAFDPQTGTTYTATRLVDGSGGMEWERRGWGCAAVWCWSPDAPSPAQRRRQGLTLAKAYAAIVSDGGAPFVGVFEAGPLRRALAAMADDAARQTLAIEPAQGALLIRYRRVDEGVVLGTLGTVVRAHGLNLAAPAEKRGIWYLIAGNAASV